MSMMSTAAARSRRSLYRFLHSLSLEQRRAGVALVGVATLALGTGAWFGLEAMHVSRTSPQYSGEPLTLLEERATLFPLDRLLYVGTAIAPLEYYGPPPPSFAGVSERLDDLGYTWAAVLRGAEVPRYFVQTLPNGIKQADSETRKRVFIRLVLPLALKTNEEISTDRVRLDALAERRFGGGVFTEEEETWLASQATRFRVKAEDLDTRLELLSRKMDVIPVSLILAQAAVESGWGTSRFALEGNALFGQRASATARALDARLDSSVRVRRFSSLADSVRSYAHNLNSHPGYSAFREARARMRADGAQGLVVPRLLPHLERYAEAAGYAEKLASIIGSNGLETLDYTRLGRHGFANEG